MYESDEICPVPLETKGAVFTVVPEGLTHFTVNPLFATRPVVLAYTVWPCEKLFCWMVRAESLYVADMPACTVVDSDASGQDIAEGETAERKLRSFAMTEDESETCVLNINPPETPLAISSIISQGKVSPQFTVFGELLKFTVIESPDGELNTCRSVNPSFIFTFEIIPPMFRGLLSSSLKESTKVSIFKFAPGEGVLL